MYAFAVFVNGRVTFLFYVFYLLKTFVMNDKMFYRIECILTLYDNTL